MSLFDKRTTFKPFEYPEVAQFTAAINRSYWLVDEWNFIADIDDFYVRLNDVQRNAIKNAMLAISQIEVSVKRFWTKIGDRFPKPEIEQVGVTFGESEIRHSLAYSHLLEVLGLNDAFNSLLDVPAIWGRIDYLGRSMAGAASSRDDRDYVLTLSLFSMFIENVSLFSQFLIIKAFNKHLNVLKDIDNVVQATQQEELTHALFGAWLVNQIRKERPEYFDNQFNEVVRGACLFAYDAERGIVDWIFERGELDFLPKATVLEFIKKRFNDSLAMIGMAPVFEIDDALLGGVAWFEVELKAKTKIDFFNKKPTSYSKRVQPITAGDLF